MADPLNDYLVKQATLITGDIDKKITPQSPWLSQIPKSMWPDEIGAIINNVVWDRKFPATETDWEDLLNTNGGAEQITCLPTPDLATFSQTTYATNLATKAVISPDFCIDDLKVSYKRKQQMGLVLHTLADVTKDYNIKRNRNSYFARCGRRVICNASLDETGIADLITDGTASGGVIGDALFPDAAPTSIATHGVLSHFHSYLDREGAGIYAAGQEGGGYIYKLITSQEHSQWLRKDDAAVRTDFRESSMADKLLKGLGVSCTHNGYVHILDALPRRWERNAGKTDANGWEEIFPWVDDGSGNFPLNPLYETASYEDLAIYVPSVMECLVPIPVAQVGRAQFSAQNYQGDYKWLNIPHKTDNPLGNIGSFYGRITNGFQTHHPEFGVVIRHQRAPFELDLTDVSGG